MSKSRVKTKYSAIKAVICLAFFAYVGYTLITQQFSISEKKAQLKAVDEQIVQAQQEKKDLNSQLKLSILPNILRRLHVKNSDMLRLMKLYL